LMRLLPALSSDGEARLHVLPFLCLPLQFVQSIQLLPCPLLGLFCFLNRTLRGGQFQRRANSHLVQSPLQGLLTWSGSAAFVVSPLVQPLVPLQIEDAR